MLRLTATITVGLTLALSGGCGGEESSSAESWADDVCTNLVDWRAEVTGIVTDLQAEGISVDAVQSAVDEGVEATQALRDDLVELGPPETESGEEVEQELDALAEQVVDDVEAARDQLEAVPENQSATALLGSLAAVASGLQSAAAEAQASLDEIQALEPGSELEEGFESAEACDGLPVEGE